MKYGYESKICSIMWVIQHDELETSALTSVHVCDILLSEKTNRLVINL